MADLRGQLTSTLYSGGCPDNNQGPTYGRVWANLLDCELKAAMVRDLVHGYFFQVVRGCPCALSQGEALWALKC